MKNRPLLGIGRFMIPLPRFFWKKQVIKQVPAISKRLEFMTEDHHRVRDFAVRELPRIGAPLEPDLIASELDLPPARTVEILDELEKRLFFLYRNERGAVAWAYPVTADSTPHHVAYSTGERLDAA